MILSLKFLIGLKKLLSADFLKKNKIIKIITDEPTAHEDL